MTQPDLSSLALPESPAHALSEIDARSLRKALEIFRSHPAKCACHGCIDITAAVLSDFGRRLSGSSRGEE